jgi:hypothetical protein
MAHGKRRRDPGSNRGPPDLQSSALPTELSRPLLFFRIERKIKSQYHFSIQI